MSKWKTEVIEESVEVTTTKHIAEILLYERKRQKMSMLDLGKFAGYTDQTISNVERNVGAPNLDTILALLKVLGLKVIIVKKKEIQVETNVFIRSDE